MDGSPLIYHLVPILLVYLIQFEWLNDIRFKWIFVGMIFKWKVRHCIAWILNFYSEDNYLQMEKWAHYQRKNASIILTFIANRIDDYNTFKFML